MNNEALLEKALFNLFERALPISKEELTDDYLSKMMLPNEKVSAEILERTQSAESFFEYILLCKVTVGEFYFYCELEMDSRTDLVQVAKLVPKEEVEVDVILQTFVVDEESLLAQCKVYNSSDTYWVILSNIKYNTTEVSLKEVEHYTLKEVINKLSLKDSIKHLKEWTNPDTNYELQEAVSPHVYIGTGVCDQRFSVGNPLQDSWYQVR